MPIYCYEKGTGKIVEEIFPIGQAPMAIDDGEGGRALRCMGAEGFVPMSTKRPGWPLTCIGSGVHPSQAGQLREYLDKRGVKTEVTREGDPVYTSPAHRRKALKARGMFDRNSFG